MPEIDVAAIRAAHPILDVVTAAGVTLTGSGRRRVGRCPFHDDRTPSLVVYPATASYFCFGCGAGGDVIDFVRRLTGTGFREAAERLRRTPPPPRAAGPPPERTPRGPERLTRAEAAVIESAVAYYAAALARHPDARRYLHARGVDPATARRLRLGVGVGGLVTRLRAERRDLAAAERLGLLAGRRERFLGRLIVPDLDAARRARWLTGRALPGPAGGGAPRYLNLRLPAPLLGHSAVALAASETVVVVEGPFDWLTACSWGLPAVALLGTHVSRATLQLLRGFRRVVVALDADAAGAQAAARLVEALAGDGGPGRTRVVALPAGAHDLSELGQRPDGRRRFAEALAAATPELADAEVAP